MECWGTSLLYTLKNWKTMVKSLFLTPLVTWIIFSQFNPAKSRLLVKINRSWHDSCLKFMFVWTSTHGYTISVNSLSFYPQYVQLHLLQMLLFYILSLSVLIHLIHLIVIFSMTQILLDILLNCQHSDP